MPRGIPKHKQQLEELEINMEKKLQEAKDNEQKEIKLQAAVHRLSRVPGQCPVGTCKDVVFPSNMMMHVLHKHMHSQGITSSEMYEHKPAVICFDPMACENGVNKCLATFLFGGVEGKPQTQPGLTYLSPHNSALFNDNRKYDNYLPIILMACRSTWYAHLKDKMLERERVSMNGNKAGIYVFWLAAPKTTRKLYYSLTVYDRHYLNSRSVIRLVRDYASHQNPSDFMSMEQNYLLLRDSEVNELMLGPNPKEKQFRLGIPMEIIIYENAAETPVHIGKRKLQEALEQLPEDYIRKYVPVSGDWEKISTN